MHLLPVPRDVNDIPTHIVEPPGIRGFLVNRLNFVIGVSCKPDVTVQCCRIIAQKSSGCRPRTAGVFLFSL